MLRLSQILSKRVVGREEVAHSFCRDIAAWRLASLLGGAGFDAVPTAGSLAMASYHGHPACAAVPRAASMWNTRAVASRRNTPIFWLSNRFFYGVRHSAGRARRSGTSPWLLLPSQLASAPAAAVECAQGLRKRGPPGGFTAAAEELFVSPGAISRHVANLEAFLGQSLFKRGRNEVRLTSAGAAYLAKVQDALDTLRGGIAGGGSPPCTQRLHVMALPTFTERWLLPRLPAFLKEHPEANVQLSTSMEEIDWDTGRRTLPSMQCWTVRSTAASCCSRRAWRRSAVLAGCARTARPGSRAICSTPSLLSSSNRLGDWLRWLHAAGVQVDAATPDHTFGSSSLAYHAAAQGLGVACAERELIGQELDAGGWSRWSELTVAGGTYFVEARPTLRHSELAQAFIGWLIERAAVPATVGRVPSAGRRTGLKRARRRRLHRCAPQRSILQIRRPRLQGMLSRLTCLRSVQRGLTTLRRPRRRRSSQRPAIASRSGGGVPVGALTAC